MLTLTGSNFFRELITQVIILTNMLCLQRDLSPPTHPWNLLSRSPEP